MISANNNNKMRSSSCLSLLVAARTKEPGRKQVPELMAQTQGGIHLALRLFDDPLAFGGRDEETARFRSTGFVLVHRESLGSTVAVPTETHGVCHCKVRVALDRFKESGLDRPEGNALGALGGGSAPGCLSCGCRFIFRELIRDSRSCIFG